MKQILLQTIMVTLFSLNYAMGQYSETFSIANKGILSGACSGSTGTSCASHDFTGVSWTIEGDLSGIDVEGFYTSGGALRATDVDEEACWVSPELDITGVSASFTLDLSWLDYEDYAEADAGSKDYIQVDYRVDGGVWEPLGNEVGGGPRTIAYVGANNQSGSATVGETGIMGSTMQIRVCFDHNSLSENSTLDNVNVSGAVLPIELISFTGELTEQKYVALAWETAYEFMNDYMAVQRSQDGIHFTDIGRVKGNGDSEVLQQYEFLDRKPLVGTNYYRLRQVDIDGAEEIHQVISVALTETEAKVVSIAPNPIRGSVKVRLSIPPSESGRIFLHDMTGQEVFQQNWPANVAEQDLNLEDLAAGMYLMRITTRNDIITQQVVKQ